MKLNPHKTGLSLGFFFAGVHLLWSVLVALGLGQTLVNFSMTNHMIVSPTTIAPFSLIGAVTLVISAFVGGYVVGWAFSWVWNQVHK
ncbi:MAG TPA: hypothetical protein VKC89_03185 [Patescibacteria group bacterium]|nr:hypothetical protein [Patescibacteria group bacterium]